MLVTLKTRLPVLQLTVTAKLCVRLLKTWAMTTISVVIPVFPWLMLLVTVVPTKWIKMATMSSIRTVANPLKDANGNKVLDENGKPVKDPKTLKPYATTDNIYEIAALPDGEEKDPPSERAS